jgi:hypothetical protein
MSETQIQNGTDKAQLVHPTSAMTRTGFGTTEVERETHGAALAESAKAEVQARFIVAMQRPRNYDEVRVRLLEHCKRPGFAARAEYAKPVGGQKIKGPTIRFVETALQEYGNVYPRASVAYDDEQKRVIRVSVTDLERNISYDDEAIVEKFVERREPKKGDEIIGSRLNSSGITVYRIRATEDDFANKVASAVSKKTRNLGLRILPADLVEEAMAACTAVRERGDREDPNAARKKLVDAFAAIRVMPSDLEDYLGHEFDQSGPAELDDLRAAFLAIQAGEARWVDLVDLARAQRGEVEKTSKAAESAGAAVQSRLAELREKRAAAAAAPKSTPTPNA